MSKIYTLTVPNETFMKNAVEVNRKIVHLISNIHNGELALATGYVALGAALLAVKENKYWVALEFKNFGEYIASIKDKIQVGRTQLYLYIATVEKLLPSITEKELYNIGITKALELKRVVSMTGQQPPQELIDLALDPKTTQLALKGEVYKHLHLTPEDKGIYFDFGFYVTEEEKAEIERGLDVAARIDPPVGNDWEENARKKEIMFRFVREFLATYEAQVAEGDIKW
jgi:hypothetical protein